MPDQWYYSKNGQRSEPVTVHQLKQLLNSGQLGITDFVWKPGMPTWIPAGQVPELAAIAVPELPPQLKGASQSKGLVLCKDCGKQISRQAPCCPHCGAPRRAYRADREAKNLLMGIAIVVLLVFLCGGCVVVVNHSR